MKRRSALKNLAMITGGLILAPSCKVSQEDILEAYDKLSVTPELKNTLASIVDGIIPSANLKGASEIEVHDFVLVMVNACVPEGAQITFMRGLKNWDKFVKDEKGKEFISLSEEEKASVLQQAIDGSDEDMKNFLTMTKRFTIQGYMQSEYIQTEVKPYSLIPGDYQGAVLISELKSERIHG